MKALQEKIISAVCLMILPVLMAAGISRHDAAGNGEAAADAAKEEGSAEAAAAEEAYQQAEEDLIFWYDDDSYEQFFALAAREYFEKTGIKALPVPKDSAEYMEAVYDSTMREDSYPDVYLISGEDLEEAYLYGLAASNGSADRYSGAAEHALTAASYRGKLLGYPLNYNACVFIYQNDYFSRPPETMEDIIRYSEENEPGENVEYLMEWDVNDAFYDFPFVANSITFEKKEPQLLTVVYEEELYQKDKEFFQELTSSFSVDAETVSEESIIKNFKEGRTLCALIDTDSLCRLEDYPYSLKKVPDLNGELKTFSCAMTKMLAVNDFSPKTQQAADFAEFVTVDMAAALYGTSGHYSVFKSEAADMVEQTAYEAYETAVLAPDSQDARDFWVGLKERFERYF